MMPGNVSMTLGNVCKPNFAGVLAWGSGWPMNFPRVKWLANDLLNPACPQIKHIKKQNRKTHTYDSKTVHIIPDERQRRAVDHSN